MRPTPSSPQPRQPLRRKPRTSARALLLSLVAAATVAGCATTTSSTGRTQYVGAVSQQELEQLGAQAFEQTRKEKPLGQDARQNAYLRCVVDALIAELPDGQRGRWEAAVFVDKSPNAFALPGGKVGVYTGLFDVAKNQHQLAAVVGHEIGHVRERHHDERVTRQAMAQLGVAVAGAAAGSRYGEGAQQTTQQLGGAAAIGLFVLPGTRAQENEADVVGQRLMAQAGFDPRQAVDLWQNMMAAAQGRPPEWLSTHPDPRSRIDEMRRRAEGLVPVYEQARASGRRPSCG